MRKHYHKFSHPFHTSPVQHLISFVTAPTGKIWMILLTCLIYDREKLYWSRATYMHFYVENKIHSNFQHEQTVATSKFYISDLWNLSKTCALISTISSLPWSKKISIFRFINDETFKKNRKRAKTLWYGIRYNTRYGLCMVYRNIFERFYFSLKNDDP